MRGPRCASIPVVTYVYMSTASGTFQPLPSAAALPGDVAMTTTSAGVTVPYVVRVETGTINRGIYQNAILFDPTSDPMPSPFSPPKGWNHRLIAIHGAGCPGGRYTQGTAEGVNVLQNMYLSLGYALFINTLQNPSNSCNPFVAGESAMMGKEHFIKTFGVPHFTLSTGGSGGAYTSLQVADAFPGLIDGIFINATFPDAAEIAYSWLDGHLLTHYFTVTNPAGFTDAQQVAVSGYAGHQAWYDAANQSQRTDPVPNRPDVVGYSSAVWNAVVPVALRYDPVSNPHGARPTIFDVSRNIYGVDPDTGFALRAFDNVGVQYGLGALNSGLITKAQFLDLNQNIGGYDQDANYVSERTAGSLGAIKHAYQAGVNLGGGGGLRSIPIIDFGYYNEAGGYHYQWHHFAVRERLIDANGDADNHVLWRGNDATSIPLTHAFAVMTQWVEAIKADHSEASLRAKVDRNKPSCCRRVPQHRQPAAVHRRGADLQQPARLAVQHLVAVLRLPALRRGRAAFGGHLEVPVEDHRSRRLRGQIHASGARALGGHLPAWRVRLVQTGPEPRRCGGRHIVRTSSTVCRRGARPQRRCGRALGLDDGGVAMHGGPEL